MARNIAVGIVSEDWTQTLWLH